MQAREQLRKELQQVNHQINQQMQNRGLEVRLSTLLDVSF